MYLSTVFKSIASKLASIKGKENLRISFINIVEIYGLRYLKEYGKKNSKTNPGAANFAINMYSNPFLIIIRKYI